MLILTRRIGEKVIIGNCIDITVLATKGRRIRLGISAPNHIPVHREEIYLQIQHEQMNLLGMAGKNLELI